MCIEKAVRSSQKADSHHISMRHRKQKKRALSDVNSSHFPNQPKKARNDRHARLVALPAIFPLSQISGSYSSPSIMQMPLYYQNSANFNQINQMMPVRKPQILQDSLFFALCPNSNNPFNFNIDTSMFENYEKRAIISSNMLTNLTFTLNQNNFLNCALPIDLTNLMIMGQNVIIFCLIGVPIFQNVAVHINFVDYNHQFQSTAQGEFMKHPTLEPTPNSSVNNHVISSSLIAEQPFKRDEFNIDEMIQNVVQNNQRTSPFDPSTNGSIIDPISNKNIVIPVRGTSCNHFQCFDLKSFLELAASYQRWQCPVCNIEIQPEQLQYDQFYLSQISQIGQDNLFDSLLYESNFDDEFQSF